jgi:hypothetical protein
MTITISKKFTGYSVAADSTHIGRVYKQGGDWIGSRAFYGVAPALCAMSIPFDTRREAIEFVTGAAADVIAYRSSVNA